MAIASEATSTGPTTDSALQLSLSCIECRRLKRKCNKQKPCNHCSKHGKQCAFPTSRQKRETRRSPLGHGSSVRRDSIQSHASTSYHRPSLPANDSALSQNPPAPQYSPVDIFASSGPATHDVYPLAGEGVNGLAAPSHHFTTPPDLSGLPALANAASSRQLELPSDTVGTSPLDAATTETLERQPRLASGYEWDERHHSLSQGQDGTACLSVEPDGDGYLGFASGATLLRILQIIAGGVMLPQHVQSRMEPSSSGGFPWRPTEIQIQDFVNAYFSSYHMQYPIIHEPTFRAQFQEMMPKPPPSSWNILSNVVIGLGAFCRGQPMQVVDHFLELATSGISATQLESGSLALVQAFTLLSNLAQKRNKVNSGSVYLGIALRMAVGLGLHRELPLWSISPFEREVRRRVWWVVFTFDAGAAVTFGRPILLPSAEADVHPVRNVWDRSFPPSSRSPPAPIDEPTIYSSLVYQSSFHMIGNKCYNRTISSPAPSSASALLSDQELQEWHRQLPPYLKVDGSTVAGGQSPPWLAFSAQKLFWRYCNLRIIIGRRAFLERALKSSALSSAGAGDDPDSRSAAICLTAALDSIRAINAFCAVHASKRLEWWYQLHFLFHASFVPLIALHTDQTSPDRGVWSEAVDQALGILRALSEEPLAQRCLQVVEALDPRRPFNNGQMGDVFQWTDLLQMDLLGDAGGQMGGQAETLLPFADFATLASLWPTDMHG